MAANYLQALPLEPPASNQNMLAPAPTMADAYDYNSSSLANWIAQQRAQSVAMGLLDPETGLPTKAGAIDAARQFANAIMAGSVGPELRGRVGNAGAIDLPQLSAQQGIGQSGVGGNATSDAAAMSTPAKPMAFRNLYEPRTADDMRLFQTPARVSQMPNGQWAVERPAAGGKWQSYSWDRFPTQEDAQTRLAHYAPDEHETAAYSAVTSGDLVGGIQKELQDRGFNVTRSDADSTTSKYLYVPVGDNTIKLRFADHAKTAPVGGTNRTQYPNSFDFDVNGSKPKLTARMASVLKLIGYPPAAE